MLDTQARNVLLAGAGDVCRRVGRLLAERGDQVWGLRRHPPVPGTGDIHWITADLTVGASLAALPSRISHLVYAPAPDTRDEPAYRSVFITGLGNLLDRMDHQALERIVFISSSAVYGDHGDAWVDEDTRVQPRDFNGRILVEAEQRLLARRPDAVILRLAGLYGPARLQLLARLKKGQARVPGAGRQWANRVHTDDAARATAHVLALPDPETRYVVADDAPHRIGELYDRLATMLDAPPVPRNAENTAGSGRRLCNARLKASGFTPRWPDAIAGYQALAAEAGLLREDQSPAR